MIILKEIAERIQGKLIGDGFAAISGISGIQDAKEGDIAFIIDKSFIKFLKACKASAIIVGKDINPDEFKGKNIIISQNPALAYAKVAEIFHPVKNKETGVNTSAFVSGTSQIFDDATIYPYAYIGEKAVIGKKAVIYPFVHIGNDVTVGEETVIYPNVVVYDNVIIGRKVTIHSGTVLGSDGFGYIWDGDKHVKIPQIGIVEIEDNVEIGANVTIDRASLGKTIIKKGTKIDNLVQIAHNVSIGENSIIVSQVGIAGSTTIGKNVILAGQVGVRDHVVIGDNVKAAGGTGITKSVPENSLISGNPHMPHKEWLRFQGHLKNLPKLYDRMKKIEKKLEMEVDND